MVALVDDLELVELGLPAERLLLVRWSADVLLALVLDLGSLVLLPGAAHAVQLPALELRRGAVRVEVEDAHLVTERGGCERAAADRAVKRVVELLWVLLLPPGLLLLVVLVPYFRHVLAEPVELFLLLRALEIYGAERVHLRWIFELLRARLVLEILLSRETLAFF